MEKDKVFDLYTKEHGGLYTGENEHIGRIKRNFYEQYKFYLYGKNLREVPDIHFNVTNYDRFQAYAFKKNGHYYIALSIGAIRSLYNFFCYLYSQPSFLSGAFGGNEESEITLTLNPIHSRLIDNFYNYDFEITPSTVIRKSLAYETFYKAIDYLLMHEVAHITHGHLDYNTQTDGHFMMFEEDKIKKTKMDIRKSLEYDADCTATVFNLQPLPFLGWNTHNAEIEVRALVIAMYFLFKLPALKEYNIEDFHFRTYPSPDQRLSIQLANIASFYASTENLRSVVDIEKVIGTSQQIYFDCINITEKIFGLKRIEDKSLFFFSQQSHQYLATIRDSWNEIRDDLEKIAFVSIAPKDDEIDLTKSFDYDEIISKRSDEDVDSDNSI